MKLWWKVLVVLAFVLPVGGYVVGSLVASSVEDPAPRAPVRLAPAAEVGAGGTGSPTPGAVDGPTTGPTDEPVPVRPQVGDDQGGPPTDDDAGEDDD